jgi:DNA polymerase
MNIQSLNQLHEQIAECKECNEIRGYHKFPAQCHGNVESGIMLVSEGAYLPSIQAGRYFTRGHLRDALPNLEELCYLTDVIKCDTTCGKTPSIANRCLPFLLEEIRILQPRLILAVGKMPFEQLVGKVSGKFADKHGKRGKFFYKEIEVVPIIHPSWANKHFPIEPKVENYRKSLRTIMGL